MTRPLTRKRLPVSCVPLEARRLLAAITSGSPIIDSVQGNAVDSYTIDVTAGAPFLVAVHDESGTLSPRLRVTGPSGGSPLIDVTDADGASRIVSTPTTGTYTIQISAGSGSGTYKLITFRPSTVTNDDDLIAAISGRRFAKQMDPGDIDFFTIDATVGQSLTATMTENTPSLGLDPRARLISPDGRVVVDQFDEHGVRVEDRATRAGRYFVVATDNGDDDSGIYGMAITQVPSPQYEGDPDTAPLVSGTTRNGDAPAGDADVVEIPNILVGDQLSFVVNRGSTGSLDPDVVLYGPDGATLKRGTRSNGNATSSLTATATTAGSYWVLIRDYEADDGGTFTVNYNLTSNGPIINRVLHLSATSSSDEITIDTTGSLILVNTNGTAKSYDKSAVDSIELFGNDGDDYIDMRKSSVPTYATGGRGDDTILGGSANDSLTGGAGRNRLYGGEGNDRLNGSNGRDFFYGEGGDDRLYGGDGQDYLDGGAGRDRLYGGEGDDFLEGGSNNDFLYGEGGNDLLQGSKGKRPSQRRRRHRHDQRS